jgi:acyl-CoA reductase-like NAD-dependent aldehyde dehydrogenase
MQHFPILRWGEPYTSLEKETVVHFDTGEPICEVSQANGGLIDRDMRKAGRARELLLEMSCDDLMKRMQKAGELFRDAELPFGDGTQTADDFVRQQSATTGLPEHMCRKNMAKICFVLENMDKILDALTRGLDLSILAAGYGVDSAGRKLSYQAQTPVLGMVLPSNSPGVHTLWLPVVPLQIGLVLKPGPQEPWTPYRMAEAMFKVGVPRQALGVYPGGAEAGAAVVNTCPRSLIFGGQPTVDRYASSPGVQAHGPGYSKILFGEDQIDDWEKHLDLMVDSVLVNSGRSCINCSGIWVPRHGKAIAEALAKRLGPVAPLGPTDEEAALAAFTVAGVAEQISAMIDKDVDVPGVEEVTAKYRDGDRLVTKERCSYLRPTVVYCESPEPPIAKKEFMFPFVTVVECPQDKMLESIGPTLVGSGITEDEAFRGQLIGATHIDRLNLGAIPTIQLDWLQPHEGNIVDFLYKGRALQVK